MTSPLLDISRLFYRRLRGRLPTGIDRVSLEYVRHYAGRARAVLGVRPFFSVLDRAESERAFRAVLDADGSGDLAALAARAYLRWWTCPDVSGCVLLNTSHTSLDHPRYALPLRRRGARAVIFVHDLIPITHPQYCRRGERERHIARMRTAVSVAHGIITPSRHTLDSLARFCADAGLALPRAVVAPLASSLPRVEPGPRPLAQPYFVVVGTIEPRKNLLLLLELWRGLVERYGDAAPRLVVIGQRGWECEKEVALLESAALRGHVLERNGCGDRELVTWLAHAQALLFPSFEEGYGLPLAEALALRVPVIAADLPAFREIAGGIPEYADPRDSRRWAELIGDYARPAGALRPSQLARVAGFRATSWAEHFETVGEFLRDLAADRGGPNPGREPAQRRAPASPGHFELAGGLLNFASRSVVDAGALFSPAAKSIVVVADNAEALPVAVEIARQGRKVTFLFAEERADGEDTPFSPDGDHDFSISSLDELCDIPFSHIEAQCAGVAAAFSADLSRILEKMAGHVLSAEVIGALTIGLQNSIYYDALRFHTAGYCVKHFDAALLLIDDAGRNLDVIKSFLCHGRAAGRLDRVFCASSRRESLQAVESLFEGPQAARGAPVDERGLAAEFSRLWKAVSEDGDRYSEPGGYVAICGSVVNNSELTSRKLVEILARRSAYPLLFHPSVLMSTTGREEAKNAISRMGLGGRCSVYEGSPRRYRATYPAAVIENLHGLFHKVFELLLAASRASAPEELLDVLAPRLSQHVRGLAMQVIFASEAMRAMGSCKLVATALDRTIVSRILCAIARDKSIPSIGIQPLIISASPRYCAPAVDRMGIIDTAQREIHRDLGARPESLEVIGSLNYVERLKQIDARAAELGAPGDPRTILFAMQHSNADHMIAMSLALREIADRHGLTLIVKPHPQQELPVVHEVRRIFGQCRNASVLPRNGDTYGAVAQSGIVVGLNSNVLLEAALSGKPVLVAAFADLPPSIDFSLLGIALKSADAAALERHILDVIAGGPLSRQLEATREEYLRRNPQFSRPYSVERIESFIASALDT